MYFMIIKPLYKKAEQEILLRFVLLFLFDLLCKILSFLLLEAL